MRKPLPVTLMKEATGARRAAGLLALAAAVAALAAQASAQTPNARRRPAPPIPSSEVLNNLVSGTLIAVEKANKTANYAPLYRQFTPDVQSRVDQKQIARVLSSFRDRGIDLSSVAGSTPQYLDPPHYDESGALDLTGVYTTKERFIRFRQAFRQIDGAWRIEALNVDTPSQAELAAASAPSGVTALAAMPTPAVAKSQTGAAFDALALDRRTDPPTTTKW